MHLSLGNVAVVTAAAAAVGGGCGREGGSDELVVVSYPQGGSLKGSGLRLLELVRSEPVCHGGKVAPGLDERGVPFALVSGVKVTPLSWLVAAGLDVQLGRRESGWTGRVEVGVVLLIVWIRAGPLVRRRRAGAPDVQLRQVVGPATFTGGHGELERVVPVSPQVAVEFGAVLHPADFGIVTDRSWLEDVLRGSVGVESEVGNSLQQVKFIVRERASESIPGSEEDVLFMGSNGAKRGEAP